MAKNTNDPSNKKNKKKVNPILWFFFAIIVPLFVALTIIFIVFKVAGIDVIDWAKSTGNNIPVLSSVISTDKEKNDQRTEQTFKDTVKTKDKKIEELKKNVSDLEDKVDTLDQKNVKLQHNDKTKSEDTKTEDSTVKDEKNKQLKTMTASFEQMDPAQTALIFQDLEEGMVIAILKGLPEDVRAGILEQMDPKKAAQYTKAYLSSND